MGDQRSNGQLCGRRHGVECDISCWRTIPLGVDGVLAMKVNAFHHNFAGTGGAQ